MRRGIVWTVAVIGLLALNLSAAAQEQKPKKQVVPKEIMGTVSGVSGNFIAVVCGRNPESGVLTEMAFNLGKEVKLKNKKSLKDINTDDAVRVLYDEVTEIKDGGRKSTSNVAKEIVFLRPAEKKPEPAVQAGDQATAGE